MARLLIHIGYHKTGTTWLQKRLFAREDLGFRRLSLSKKRSDFVRVHDFDFDPEVYRREFEPQLARCAAEGRVAVISHERLSGNPHSGGFDSRTLADRLAQVFPDARIFVVIREQRAMILSAYAQYVRAGGLCSLRGYLAPPRDHRLPMFRLDHFRYDRLIAHYQKRFGREHVLVLSYERFRADPAGFVEDLCRFAGVTPPASLSTGRVENRSLGPVALGMQRWLNPFVVRDSLNANSPWAIPALRGPTRLLVRGIDRVSPAAWNARVRRRWEARVDAVTAGRYEVSNRATESLTGLDLTALGYAT